MGRVSRPKQHTEHHHDYRDKTNVVVNCNNCSNKILTMFPDASWLIDWLADITGQQAREKRGKERETHGLVITFQTLNKVSKKL